jgi:ribokinase
MAARIAVVGSINMDLVIRAPRFVLPGETLSGGPFAMFPGGKGANQAVAAARLGAEVAMIGCVGTDDFGARMIATLDEEGIDLSHLRAIAGEATGVGCITVDARGENAIVIASGANMCVTPDHIDAALETLARADVILMQLEVPMETIEHLVRRREELRASLVLNAAPARDIPDEVIGSVDVLVVNETEAEQMARRHVFAGAGAIEPTLLAENLGVGGNALAIITRGGRGAISWSAADGAAEHSAFAVDVVDSTAAGDAFCGALAVALAESRTLEPDVSAAVRFASAAGSLACTRHGALLSLPTRAEVSRLLQKTVPGTVLSRTASAR